MRTVRKIRSIKAFTLVELLVVIAIISIISTVTIVGYSEYTKRANSNADRQLVAQLNIFLDTERVKRDYEYDILPSEAIKIINEYGVNLNNKVLTNESNRLCYNSITEKFFIEAVDDNHNAIKDIYGKSYNGADTDFYNNVILYDSNDYIVGYSSIFTANLDIDNIEYTCLGASDPNYDFYHKVVFNNNTSYSQHNFIRVDDHFECEDCHQYPYIVIENTDSSVDGYNDLARAVKEVDNNETIYINKDLTGSKEIELTLDLQSQKEGIKYSLDLLGHTVSFQRGVFDSDTRKTNSFDVSIRNGTINYETAELYNGASSRTVYYSFELSVDGNVELNNLTINGYYTSFIVNKGTLKINNCLVNNQYGIGDISNEGKIILLDNNTFNTDKTEFEIHGNKDRSEYITYDPDKYPSITIIQYNN